MKKIILFSFCFLMFILIFVGLFAKDILFKEMSKRKAEGGVGEKIVLVNMPNYEARIEAKFFPSLFNVGLAKSNKKTESILLEISADEKFNYTKYAQFDKTKYNFRLLIKDNKRAEEIYKKSREIYLYKIAGGKGMKDIGGDSIHCKLDEIYGLERYVPCQFKDMKFEDINFGSVFYHGRDIIFASKDRKILFGCNGKDDYSVSQTCFERLIVNGLLVQYTWKYRNLKHSNLLRENAIEFIEKRFMKKDKVN